MSFLLLPPLPVLFPEIKYAHSSAQYHPIFLHHLDEAQVLSSSPLLAQILYSSQL